MKRNGLAFDVIALAALAGVLAFTASVYDALPARMATHFGLRGEPNGWMDRPYATWGVEVFGLLFWAGIRVAPAWLPEKNGWRSRAAQSPIAAIAMMSLLLVEGVSAFVVWNGLHPEASRGPMLCLLIGSFMVAYSTVLPRTRRNPFLGVRTTFSLTSDENWARTNRFASYAFALGGLACAACGLAAIPAVGIAALIGSSLAPWAYSWVLAYRLPPEA